MRIHATAQFTARLGITLLAALASAQVQPVRWNAQYTEIYFDNIENGATAFDNAGASVVTDPSLVLAGHASIRLKNFGGVTTNPVVVPMSGNTTYIVEFKYHILNYGSSDGVLGVWLFPAGDDNQQHGIPASGMNKSTPATGKFSAGALTVDAAQYVFRIYSASPDSDVVIDDIRVLRQDAAQQTALPPVFTYLETLPFPRLGKYYIGGTSWPRKGMLPFQYSVDQIESRLAFYDVIAGLWVDSQTSDAASIRRLRQLNSKAVILPYRMSSEQEAVQPPAFGANVSLLYSIFQGIPDDWYVKETRGNYAVEDQYPVLKFLNISPFSPVIGGQTYFSYLLSWLSGKVFPSGVWDGVFLDNLFAEANIHIRNLSNPALLDFDYNRNGIRDETPASISDVTRGAVVGLLQQLRAANGDLQLVMGNAGALPELSLAPYVNGYTLECASDLWNAGPFSPSPAAWRGVFDAYRAMQASSRRPRITVFEACGDKSRRGDGSYLAPTVEDLRTHRLALGTTLLSDGFYSFDLHDNTTVPLWYDEYSVDAKGNAVEDRTKKGYLGAALTDAVELTDDGPVMLQENFEGAILPPAFRANPASAVSVSNGALIISNPDHTQNGSVGVSTNPSTLRLDPGTYLLTFDWRVLETLDHPLSFNVRGSRQLDSFRVPWVVTGDFGTVHFPFVISSSDAWSIGIDMSGGGKVAIDNIRVVRGGVGPWRRDFENGFVLVNPLPQPRTFSATELTGTRNRTVIHRINGTQAPDANNGQPVTGDLTLGAFDSIILLADHIGAPKVPVPNITLVANAFGDTPLIAPNTWVEIKGANLAPAGDTRIWQESDFTVDYLPLRLDDVSVTVNGRVAYPYFISPTQVNILTPPDPLSGPVQVQLTIGGVASNAVTVQAQPQSLSFFEFVSSSGRHYVYGRHISDNTIIGPTDLFPGLTTPVKPGETIYVAGNGFGATSVPVLSGALTQSGTLPTPWPLVSVGSAPATVLFAGLVAPGTYIFNITLPSNLPDGDLPLTATYNGHSIQPNLYITVKR